MSVPFEGPESEHWIEPFGAFLIEQGLLAKAQVQRASRLVQALDTRLGWLAVAIGYMSARDVYAVLSKAQDRQSRFGELSIELGLLTEHQVEELLALQHSPFRLFVHCLLLTDEVDGCTLYDLLDSFVEREGLDPSWSLGDGQRLGLRSVDDSRLWRTLDGVRTLTTLPQVAPRVLALIEQEDPEPAALGELIGRDPALAAQLLRVAASASNGPRATPRSVLDAIEALGGGVVRQLVLTPTVLSSFDAASVASARALWIHSLRTAVWCRALREPLGIREDPFLHGLLHEIGQVALLQVLPEECAEVESLARGDATREQSERQVLGTTRADVGAYLCRQWALHDGYVQAVLHHATPTVLLRQTPDLLPTTRVVHAACRLAETASETGTAYLDAAFQAFHDLDLDRVAALAPRVEETCRELLAALD